MLLQSVASLNDAASASSTLSDSKGSILSDVNDALLREIKTFEAREKLIYHFKVISCLIMSLNCSYEIRKDFRVFSCPELVLHSLPGDNLVLGYFLLVQLLLVDCLVADRSLVLSVICAIRRIHWWPQHLVRHCLFVNTEVLVFNRNEV